MSQKKCTFAAHFIAPPAFVRVRARKDRQKDMKYSRSNLNRVGTYLYAEEVDAFKRSEAIQIVSDWRMTHLPVLREFVESLTSYLAEQNVKYAFYSQRVKLREAYPSYFLDTKEFLLALEEFNASCAIYRK